MIDKKSLIKISDFLWEIPKSYQKGMRVAARIYSTEKMLRDVVSDRSLEQLINVSMLPGIVGFAFAMPDVHEGYGFPIGGVAATRFPDGGISPGGIGYDINCGVRLLTSKLTFTDVRPHIQLLAQRLYQQIPSGVGQGGFLKLSHQEYKHMLTNGVKWAQNQGYAHPQDVDRIESSGKIPGADPDMVSDHAKKRGRNQLGTLGAGNHFVEIDRVDTIFNQEKANIFGLFPDQIVILIHTGSRGFGHQVATDNIKRMRKSLDKYQISLPDPELACAPFSSPEGKSYHGAMAAAANFAFVNRQLITWTVRNIWQKNLGQAAADLSILYDVAHNIAKLEEHEVFGKSIKVILHRKGATRAFGPNHPELPKDISPAGQPVLIPGSMGTASYVLAGSRNAMSQSFGSACHGAGRRMSRHRAKKEIRADQLRSKLEREGITIMAGSLSGLAEEAPLAYKDVDQVVDIIHMAGIAEKVARLKPLAVIKG